MRTYLALLVAMLWSLVSDAGAADSKCSTAAHRQFDFWLGEWNVGAQGKIVGTNSIQREEGGCVLHERYTTSRGYSGQSFNIYDASRKVWHQTWVDSDGLLLILEGRLANGKMTLEGQTIDGEVTKHRITWTPNSDGSVRQLWESTDKNGKWSVVFDGLYTKRK